LTLRGLPAALRALNWRRGLTRLVLVIAVPTALHAIAYQLVDLGVYTALRELGAPRTPIDTRAITAEAMLRFERGLSGPTIAVIYVFALTWVMLGFGASGAAPAEARGKRARTIRTARLVLRRPEWEDLAAMHAIFSDAETLRYWDRLPYRSEKETEGWMERLCALPPETSDMFVVEREGRVIGIVGSMALPWLTYLLARSEWGQGYAREALGAFVGYCFGRGLTQLCAATHPDNAASLALLRGLGFEEHARSNGLFTIGGEPGDAVHFRRVAPQADAAIARSTRD
jgi:[ribosomal protein S5]-alanine N-acetyltransferase